MRTWQARFTAACLGVCVAALLGCGDTDDPLTPDSPTARVLYVSKLDLGPQTFVYGQTVRVIFDRDPGVVTVEHDGDLAGSGTNRVFAIKRSPMRLTWQNGGVLVLEYDPIERE